MRIWKCVHGKMLGTRNGHSVAAQAAPPLHYVHPGVGQSCAHFVFENASVTTHGLLLLHVL